MTPRNSAAYLRVGLVLIGTLLLGAALAAQTPPTGRDENGQPLPDPFVGELDNPETVPQAGDPPPMAEATGARLRGLDTLTNTVDDFQIQVGETLRFKRLIVTLEACRYPADDPAREAYAFLRIRDQREEADRFDGWMLASSPALSALDHPRYDIWVLSCSTD